jgi:hypothetical protein
MARQPKQSKTTAEVKLDGQTFTQLTKIEIAPIINQNCYAITLRFIVTDNFEFPKFKDGNSSRLSFHDNNLPNTFNFAVEYLDLGLESNPNLTELTVFLRGRKLEAAGKIIELPKAQLVV